MSEFADFDITVESRKLKTGRDPVKSIEDLFVSTWLHAMLKYVFIIVYTPFISTTPTSKLKMEDLDYRVFFLNCYSDLGRKIICYVSISIRCSYTRAATLFIVYS